MINGANIEKIAKVSDTILNMVYDFLNPKNLNSK